MVAVGAVLTGTMTTGYRVDDVKPASADPRVRVLAARFVKAGAELDSRGISELIAAYCSASPGGVDEVLVDVLVELTECFAGELDRTQR